MRYFLPDVTLQVTSFTTVEIAGFCIYIFEF